MLPRTSSNTLRDVCYYAKWFWTTVCWFWTTICNRFLTNKEFCSECVMCLGASTHTKPQISYFVVVYLFRVLIKTYSPSRQRWWYTWVNFHWARVRFGPVPFASCGNGWGVNSPAAVSFTVLSQSPRLLK